MKSKFRGEDPRVPGFVDRHFAPPLRVMFIGAHPDDPDVRCSGFARTLVEAGHRVRFVAVCNGDKGHQFMDSPDLARRRYGESRHEDVIVDTFACHESQMFEWLVPEHGASLDDVPPASDVEGRRAFVRRTALHLVADYAHAFSDSVERAYPGRRPKLVEVYEKSEYGRTPVQAERDLLASLGGVWIDSTESKWTQVK